MLCKTCQNKVTIQTPGQCKSCHGPTTHFVHSLCSPCSLALDECEWCQTPLNPPAGTIVAPPPGSNAPFVTLLQGDDGSQVNGLNIGDEIHVILDEDQYSGKEWDLKSITSGFCYLQTKGQFVPNPNNPQYGQREFTFAVIRSGSGEIEFHEVHRTWSWGWGSSSSGKTTAVAGGAKWKSDFQVK